MITLKHFTDTDIPMIRNYLTDPDVSKYLTWKPYSNDSEMNAYYTYARECTSFPDEIFIIYTDTTMIGTAHIIIDGEQHKTAKMGFGLLPEYWHKGLGANVLHTILEYITNSPEWSSAIERVQGSIHIDNTRAKKMALSCGFQFNSISSRPHYERFFYYLSKTEGTA